MKPSMPESLEYLRHILDEARYLAGQRGILTQEEFLEDETLKRAFVRSLEIIGEAAKKVSDDVKAAYPDIEWRAMAGMRDRLIHGYFGVDYDLVWDVVAEKIPTLLSEIQEIVDSREE